MEASNTSAMSAASGDGVMNAGAPDTGSIGADLPSAPESASDSLSAAPSASASESVSESASVPGSDSASDSAPAEPQPVTSPGRSRAKAALLALLMALAVGLASFSAWYLITRKPVTALPLPGMSGEAMPHYSFSIYGATNPIGVAVSPDGSRIYVAESGGEALVRVYDGSGNQIATMKPPSSTAASRVPTYVALDPVSGDVYVADRASAQIFVFDRDGAYRRTFSPGGGVKGWAPLGLTFDSAGNLYVGNVGASPQDVVEFDRQGNLVRSVGSNLSLSFPNGIAVDAAGDIYVADGTNGRLLALKPDGTTGGEIPRGNAVGDLGLPRGVAIDDDRRLYVADASAQQIQIYSMPDGKTQPAFIGSIGSIGRGDGQFAFPNGVAVDARGRIYVADWDNNRVQVWSY